MLNIEVIKFEAQDVITASCICKNADFCGGDPQGKHYAYDIVKVNEDGTPANIKYVECKADKHAGCKEPNF